MTIKPSLSYLQWSPGSLSLFSALGGSFRLRSVLAAPSADRVGRFGVAIRADPGLITLTVPAGDSRGPFLQSKDGGRNFLPVEPVPGESSLSEGSYRAHCNGCLTVIERQVLWYRFRFASQWVSYKVPEGLRVLDASVNPSGRIHIVGTQDSGQSTEPMTEPVLAVIDGVSFQTVDINLSDNDYRLWVNASRDTNFRKIDAEGVPILIASDCWTFWDRLFLSFMPSCLFVLVQHPVQWVMRLIKDQNIFVIRDRPDTLSIYTTQGKRIRTDTECYTWKYEDLIPAISAIGIALKPKTLSVTAVAARGDDLAIAITCHNPHDPQGLEIVSSSVLLSRDDGRTFQVAASISGPNSEVRGILLGEL